MIPFIQPPYPYSDDDSPEERKRKAKQFERIMSSPEGRRMYDLEMLKVWGGVLLVLGGGSLALYGLLRFLVWIL